MEDQLLIDQLAKENQQLRMLLRIDADISKQMEIDSKLREEEVKLEQPVASSSSLPDETTAANSEQTIDDALKRMIMKASQEIKKKKQDRSKNNEMPSDSEAGSSPEKQTQQSTS